MGKIIILCLLCGLIAAGCARHAKVESSNDSFNARYAGEINDRTTGVVCYNGYLYVYGSYKGYLKKINLTTGELTTLVCDYVAVPHGLAVYNDNIWITDTQNHQVFKLDLNGNLLASFGEKGVLGCDKTHFNAPTHIAVAPNGNIYVTDGYGNRRVVCLNSKGEYLFEWGKEGGRPGEFLNPHDIVIVDEKVYVADRDNNRMQIFTMDGKYLGQWNQDGKLFGIWYSDNKMYMSIQAPQSHYIMITDMDGKLIEKFGQQGSGSSEFDVPHSLTVDKKYIYVAEVGNKRIQRINIDKK